MSSNFPECPLLARSRVWVYLRDSGGDSQDLASQRAYVIAYCKHYRLELKRIFADAAISGGSISGREEFELMIDLSQQHPQPTVDGILYWDTKRFARNQLDSQFYKADLRRRGYKLISLSDDIPGGELSIVYESILEWKAQKDREDISKDTKRGLAFIVSLKDEEGNYLGLFPGRPPTFFRGEAYDTGLIRNDGRSRIIQRLVPDEQVWELGKKAFELRALGSSYKEIERQLNLFPKTKNYSSTYTAIFRNEIYIGRLRYGGQVYDNFVPALTTPEQWEAVQKLRVYHPRRSESWSDDKLHPKARHGRYLLSGLCYCQYCQSRMHGMTNTRSGRQQFWKFYVCSRKKARPEECLNGQASAQRLEKAIIDRVDTAILTPTFVETLLGRVNNLLSNTEHIEQMVERKRAQLKALDRKITNLLNELEEMPSNRVRQRLIEREQEQRNVEREISQLSIQLERGQIRVEREVIFDCLTKTKYELQQGELRARQAFLRNTIERVEVGRGEARLYWKNSEDLREVYSMPPTGFEPVSPP